MIAPASLLHPDAFLSPLAIDEAVDRALDEDLGRAGDITSLATIPEAIRAHAILVARQAGVIAGLPLALALAVLIVAALVPIVYSFVHYKVLERRGAL